MANQQTYAFNLYHIHLPWNAVILKKERERKRTFSKNEIQVKIRTKHLSEIRAEKKVESEIVSHKKSTQTKHNAQFGTVR